MSKKKIRTLKIIDKSYKPKFAEAKKIFLQRTGKKIARGFEKSPEYKRVYRNRYQARYRFNKKLEQKILDGLDDGEFIASDISQEIFTHYAETTAPLYFDQFYQNEKTYSVFFDDRDVEGRRSSNKTPTSFKLRMSELKKNIKDYIDFGDLESGEYPVIMVRKFLVNQVPTLSTEALTIETLIKEHEDWERFSKTKKRK